ncbi:type III-A CRISPR-associated protein Cas10/Csm1 [Calditerrivibrio nitroreducens]|uniref:CRISPR system single-strand-specific deoxyribonuclease Cas10/Csm1 (subtype III-A) n=1 Tax=Calditerrivibrio nitroreducens (strain DSM 19672 / NBRC 101217 / Yu37-1) TaxID=768670 RepID=E4TFE8_CALNY|nr:type III-A CRISPR-associated protein Cas10/Csm1 [Calditerrivibrio nitroreducens]ADR19521.1 CRISPR-associated protein, Csm1 family [Calditerrivibrio nitroreducens DSM 19672]
MNDQLLKTSLIGLAAFYHDIGKVYQRTGRHLTDKYGKGSYERQLLLNDDTHLHSLHTAYFIENNILNTPIDGLWKSTFNAPGFLFTSAAHHKPNNEILSKIVTMADQIASGLDREQYAERDRKRSQFDYRKVMMTPLLRIASLFEENDYSYRYPLSIVNLESIFPVKSEKLKDISAEENYKKIVEFFEENLNKIDYKLNFYVDGLISLFEEAFSFVPASTLGEFDDVSLYDHSRTTAAFATSLFKFYENNQRLPEYDEKAFLMIRGEFFGIQKFIFSEGAESGKNPAKILRGRSFYVSLMTEVAALMMSNKLNLPSFNLLLNAAGMFVILSDNSKETKDGIQEVNKVINDWLFEKFFGEVYFGIAYVEATPSDFSEKHYESLWLDLLTEMDKVKYSRFNLLTRDSIFENYHKQFDNAVSCSLCGRESAEKGAEYGKNCDELIKIGEQLVRKELKYLVLYRKDGGKIFNKYDYEFRSDVGDALLDASKIIDISLFDGFKGFYKSKINTYVATDNYVIKSFEEIAKGERGIDALGVFKADVDNLGALFALGLEKKRNVGENKRLTFSRISQLSRMINNFFAYYLPYKLKKDYPNTYTVFAGGDDLFLVGRYNDIFKLALELSQDFKRYTGYNNEVTISGGISIFKPNTPIAFMAEVVENNLTHSKKTNDYKKPKGYLTFLGAKAKWEDFIKVYEEVKKNSWLVPEATSFDYKLLELIEMSILLKNKNLNMQDLAKNIMWIPRLKYLLARQIKNQNAREELSLFLLDKINTAPELFKAISMFEIYNKRKKKGGKK